jgi:hypothetical protein
MTAQAQEILILEGKKTYIHDCPPLPENDSRIKQSAETSICSACWRGYVGTWEITEGQLFLVGLSGNYYLDPEESILANWYSGEIVVPEGEALKYDAMGSPYLYERQHNFTIENGRVVAVSLIDNRPASSPSDAEEIRRFVESRGISTLVHFTTVENVPGILEHGLLGRKSIASRSLKSVFNDHYRYDDIADAICASVSFPNYKMFYSLQRNNPETDWVVFRLDPSILWEIPCAFSITNAASSKVTRIPIDERKRFKSFSAMFEDIPPNIKRSDLEIPDDFCTDPQAEVLILGPVSPSYILDINVNGKAKIHDMNNMVRLFKPYSSKFKFQHDESLFTYRKDYEHWKKDQTLNDEIAIDIDNIFKT